MLKKPGQTQVRAAGVIPSTAAVMLEQQTGYWRCSSAHSISGDKGVRWTR